MGENSKIAWTHHTFNGWIGCEKVSAECDHCYAESGSKRLAAQHHLTLWGEQSSRYITSDGYWQKPLQWNRAAQKSGERARVFCASFADVFEDREDLVKPRARLLHLIEDTPYLDYLLLSKRPENMLRLSAPVWRDNWPSNVWAGTTVGVRPSLHRALQIQSVPARVKFLSLEPMIEDIGLDPPVCPDCDGLEQAIGDDGATAFCPECETEMGFSAILDPLNGGISWVIVGGESGPHARPFHLEWGQKILGQCREAGVAFFFKQAGSHAVLDGKRLKLRDTKGGDLLELPAYLNVREFPEVPRAV